MRFSPAQIRRYYDRNTSTFVALGQGGSVGAIHRAVWGPGVTVREDAFHFVEDKIAERIRELSPTGHVVDLGCGVGTSLCYLAEKLPISGTGITLSPVQATLAAERIRLAGLADRIACVEGDYTDLPAGMRRADLAYAIESFVHGPSPERFFAQCRELVRPGGLLIICDDFKRATADPAAGPAIERFCGGWHINTLIDPRELQTLARDGGFIHESTIDLSRYLELRRPRDRRARRADPRALRALRAATGRQRSSAVHRPRMDRIRPRGVSARRLKYSPGSVHPQPVMLTRREWDLYGMIMA